MEREELSDAEDSFLLVFNFWLLVANPYPLLLCVLICFETSQWCMVSLAIGVHRVWVGFGEQHIF